MKAISFKTLGCKVNQYETQAIREQFLQAGYREIQNERADIYVINTCTVTATADSKSRQLIRACHRLNPKAIIVVTGCYVERDWEDIEKIEGVDFIIGNHQKSEILKVILQSQTAKDVGSDPKEVTAGRKGLTPKRLSISKFFGHTRAFLKIQDGCNRRCSYCKVRIVRGRSRSRGLDDIIEEAKRLAEAGFKEIILCGVQLGSYGVGLEDGFSLSDVIENLEAIDGIKRIRLSSIEPTDITVGLIRRMAGQGKLCRHLHIPLQSGDDEILGRMNRGYCTRDFKELIMRIRGSVSEVSITTDIMVGFPGEKEDSFGRTLEMIRAIMPSRIHIFPYSRREGTKAADFQGTVSPREIKARVARLKEIALTSSFSYRKKFLGQSLDLLVEAKRDPKTGLLCGYTDTYIKVLIEGSDGLMNQIIPVEVTEVERDYTLGSTLYH